MTPALVFKRLIERQVERVRRRVKPPSLRQPLARAADTAKLP